MLARAFPGSALSKCSGIVPASGPQRSGKTNTLYSAITAVNKPDTSIVTAEDPVELSLPGVNQVQIDKAIGESAVSVLRSFDHADADVVLVSEMGDPETAKTAVRLAQQGHLVLSSLQASDAASTVLGLLNMGVDPYLLATTVNVILSQRLVRRICGKCKVDVTAEVPSKTLLDIGFTPQEIGSFRVMKGRGCQACNGTGYTGRVGLFEVMEITEWIRDLIMAGAGAVEIRRKALDEGMLTLRMSRSREDQARRDHRRGGPPGDRPARRQRGAGDGCDGTCCRGLPSGADPGTPSSNEGAATTTRKHLPPSSQARQPRSRP